MRLTLEGRNKKKINHQLSWNISNFILDSETKKHKQMNTNIKLTTDLTKKKKSTTDHKYVYKNTSLQKKITYA